jgi:hypothetical protein
MWITSITVPEDFDMVLVNQLITDALAEKDRIISEGVETLGHLLEPYDIVFFTPGAVLKRTWALESSARRMANFINNHESKQLIVVVEEQQDI